MRIREIKANEALVYVPGLANITYTIFSELMDAESMGTNAVKEKYEMIKNGFSNNFVVFAELLKIIDYRRTTCFEKGNLQFADAYREIKEDADRWQKAHFNHNQRKYIRDAKKPRHK